MTKIQPPSGVVSPEVVQENKALLKPGVAFSELVERLRPLADEFIDGRYSVAMHGTGLCDEYPSILYLQD